MELSDTAVLSYYLLVPNKHFAFLVKEYNFSMTEHKTVMYTTWVRFRSEEYEVTIGQEFDVLFAHIESISEIGRAHV